MQHTRFERLKLQVSVASAMQLLELEDLIQQSILRQFAESALARRTRQACDTRTCPHCCCHDVVLHGSDQNGRQRFKCRGCRKTYNILTGTPMARARKPEKWGQYLDCMTEHMSVRKIVETGIGLHQVTAWRWRHRFLRAAANDNAAILSGVIEADTTFFRRSFKGSREGRLSNLEITEPALSDELVPVLTALDSSGGVFQAILESLTEIEEALQGRIAAGSVLCSDNKAFYEQAADSACAEHRLVGVAVAAPDAVKSGLDASPALKPARLGLGRVSAHHKRLKYLVNEQCRGVATKYLMNYLGWHRAMVRPGFEGKALLLLSLA